MVVGVCRVCGADTVGYLDGMGNLICEDCKNDEVFV